MTASRFQRPYSLSVVPSPAGTYYHPLNAPVATALVVPTLISTTTATYTAATKTITQANAFTLYVFAVGDLFVITAGTGATLGTYTVASRVSNNAITVVEAVAAGDLAAGDLTGSITVANQLATHLLFNNTQSPKGIIILRIEANSVAAAATDSIAVTDEGGTTLKGAIFLARAVTLGGPVLDAKPEGIVITSSTYICYKTIGTTAWTVQFLTFDQ